MIAKRTAAGVQWGTQKAVIRVISSCLRWAVSWGHLDKNPAIGLIRDLRDDSDPTQSEPDPNPLSAESADAFLSWLATGRIPNVDRPVDGPRLRGGSLRSEGFPEWVPFFLTLLRTGMRRGEASGLKWKTVFLDVAKPRARLERSDSPSARALGPGVESDVTLKNKRAREVELAGSVVEALRGLYARDLARAVAAGGRMSPYVFVGVRRGRVLADSSTADRIFERGMIAIGLEDAGHTIHDLRDTFATLHLAQDPGRLSWISAMLGHRHVSTTLNRYVKYVPQLAGSCVDDLDAPATAPGRVGRSGGQ